MPDAPLQSSRPVPVASLRYGAKPILLAPSVQGEVYGLFALAMALTVLGVFLGMQAANILLATGWHFFLLFLELTLIFTAGWWMRVSPWNYVLFGFFPLLSGITVTPYILYVLAGYANGGSILLNALVSTVFMAAAAAVLARFWDLSGLARTLFLALLGLVLLAVLQLFVPALRSTGVELMASGAGVFVFALFLAFDLQRLEVMERNGASPFLLALSLYLDIFNLFLSILRFMVALSGERR